MLNLVTPHDLHFNKCEAAMLEVDSKNHSLFSSISLKYAINYIANQKYINHTAYITEGNDPICGIVCYSHTNENGKTVINAITRPTYFLQNTSAPYTKIDRGWKALKDFYKEILPDNVTWEHRDYLNTTSPLALHLLTRGASAKPYFTQLVDLTYPTEVLKQNLRKSYKSLVNEGARLFETTTHFGPNVDENLILDFMNLHIEVAGRQTRSTQTWLDQLEMVQKKEAFILTSHLNSQLVSASLFNISKKHCYYSVSASRRELFDKPIQHVSIWKAMLTAKELGCSEFELSDQVFPNYPHSNPTKKELDIATFKRGFGGELRSYLDYTFAGKLWE